MSYALPRSNIYMVDLTSNSLPDPLCIILKQSPLEISALTLKESIPRCPAHFYAHKLTKHISAYAPTPTLPNNLPQSPIEIHEPMKRSFAGWRENNQGLGLSRGFRQYQPEPETLVSTLEDTKQAFILAEVDVCASKSMSSGVAHHYARNHWLMPLTQQPIALWLSCTTTWHWASGISCKS